MMSDNIDNLDFEDLLKINCFSGDEDKQKRASEILEIKYGCEINCMEIDESVKFAHHARGSTIIAAKLSKNVVIFQNVTIGSNLKYNKITEEWENVGNPILCENVIVADGAKILGPVVIGKNSVVAAGAIVTRDVPKDSIAYGINKFKPKNPDYDLIYNDDMISQEEIEKNNKKRINELFK